MYGSTPHCSKCGKRITELTDMVMDALKLCCRACASVPLTVNAALTKIAEGVEYSGEAVLDAELAA